MSDSESDSDYEPWKYSWEGRIFILNGGKVLVEKQLTEHEDMRMAQRNVLALARYKKKEDDETSVPIMLRIRYDIDPRPFGIEDIEQNRKDVHEHVLFEMELIRLLCAAGKGPGLLTAARQDQIQTLPYPKGYVYFMALESVPGEDLNKIKSHLSGKQLQSIKRQLAGILEVMRPHDRILTEEDPSCLRYDQENDKVYLVDLTHWGYQFMQTIQRITEDSPFVEAFGLWPKRQQMITTPMPIHPRHTAASSPSRENIRPGQRQLERKD